MAGGRRTKRQTQPKYIARRAALLVICLALVGFAAYRLVPRLTEAVDAVPEEQTTQPEPQPEEQPDGDDPPQPEDEPQETEPQPEPQQAPQSDADGEWMLMLVNPTSPLPEGYMPELETLSDGYRVDVRIADSLAKMFTKAKEDGVNLMLCSAYRSPEKQQELFQAQVQQYIGKGYDEDEADALTVSAIMRPGNSEHHTGLAVDIVTPDYQTLDEGFAQTPAFKWLDENAHKYGFVLRYPKNKQEITQVIYESWHYRYVGVEHAAIIKEKGYCLEEYLYVRQGGALEPEQAEEAQDIDAEEGSGE